MTHASDFSQLRGVLRRGVASVCQLPVGGSAEQGAGAQC